jgi:DNA-binding LacI/PurR family transcriptional regulator
MAATIKDIARKLNISVSTVSYALNNGPRTVPDDVKKRVLQAAQDLQYRPNRVARNLVTRRSYTIGIVPSEASSDIVLSPYLQNSLNGIVNTAEAHHYDVLFFTRYDQQQTREMANVLLDGRADGLIFLAPPNHAPVLDLVVDYGIPHVVIAGESRADSAHFGADNVSGVRAALRHLFEIGHRRIGHLYGRLHMEDGMVRKEAYRAFLAEQGLPVNDDWMAPGEFTMNGGYSGMKQILSKPETPTAVFCANDEIAVGAIHAASELGLAVPRDMSIVGFDNAPLSAAFLPAITTIRQPVQELASEATQALIRLIDGSPGVPSQVFPTELIVRDSTSRPKEDH